MGGGKETTTIWSTIDTTNLNIYVWYNNTGDNCLFYQESSEKNYQIIMLARIKIKPSKRRIIFIVKGHLTEQRFYIDKTPVLTVLEMPPQSLGSWYDTKDTKQFE